MTNIRSSIDRKYLRRCKYASNESKLDWLAAALEFVRETERSNSKKNISIDVTAQHGT